MKEFLRALRNSICFAEAKGKSNAIFNAEHKLFAPGFFMLFVFAGFTRPTAQNCSVNTGKMLNEAIGMDLHEDILNRRKQIKYFNSKNFSA